MKWIVILEVRAGGSPCGSTEDVIDALTAEQAETKAIALWRAARPDRTFAPLLTLVAHRRPGDVVDDRDAHQLVLVAAPTTVRVRVGAEPGSEPLARTSVLPYRGPSGQHAGRPFSRGAVVSV